MKNYNIVYLGAEGSEKSFLGLKEILDADYNVSLVVVSKNICVKQTHLSKIDKLIASFIFLKNFIRFVIKKLILPKKRLIVKKFYIRELCIKKNIPVITYTSFKIGDIEDVIRRFNPEIIISNGWMWYISKKITKLARIVSLNCHSAYLPNYRGGNVTFAPLINRELTSGVTVHTIEEKFDSGKILSQISIKLSSNETISSLNRKRANITGAVLIKALKIVHRPNKWKENPPSPFYKRFSYASYMRLKFINKIRSIFGLKINKVKPIFSDKL